MISSIEISRFRGIREGKLEDLTPLVVLVGPNGCGKSTILDAVLIGASRATGDGIGQAVQRHAGVKYGAPWLFWRKGIEGSSKVRVRTSGRFRRSCELRLPRSFREDQASIFCEIGTRNPDSSATVDVSFPSGKRFDARGAEIAITPPEDVADTRLVEGDDQDAQTPLHRLLTNSTEQGLFSQVLGIMTQVVPGLKDIRILTEVDAPIVQLIYEDYSVPSALAGDGIYWLLRLSLELATYPKGTMLLEEPEVHQHPGAIRQTMGAVLAAVRRDIQVILTTHSLELIDALLAESSDEDLDRLSLYRVQLENGALQSHRMSGPEVAFSRPEIENDLR